MKKVLELIDKLEEQEYDLGYFKTEEEQERHIKEIIKTINKIINELLKSTANEYNTSENYNSITYYLDLNRKYNYKL